MNLTEKTNESAEGAGAPDGAESGATLGVVENKVSEVTPAAAAVGVTLDQLQQLLSHQAASTARMMREMQTNMQNQISGAIERFEDRGEVSGKGDAAREAHLRAIHREMNEARELAGAAPLPYTVTPRAPAVSSPTRTGAAASNSTSRNSASGNRTAQQLLAGREAADRKDRRYDRDREETRVPFGARREDSAVPSVSFGQEQERTYSESDGGFVIPVVAAAALASCAGNPRSLADVNAAESFLVVQSLSVRSRASPAKRNRVAPESGSRDANQFGVELINAEARELCNRAVEYDLAFQAQGSDLLQRIGEPTADDAKAFLSRVLHLAPSCVVDTGLCGPPAEDLGRFISDQILIGTVGRKSSSMSQMWRSCVVFACFACARDAVLSCSKSDVERRAAYSLEKMEAAGRQFILESQSPKHTKSWAAANLSAGGALRNRLFHAERRSEEDEFCTLLYQAAWKIVASGGDKKKMLLVAKRFVWLSWLVRILPAFESLTTGCEVYLLASHKSNMVDLCRYSVPGSKAALIDAAMYGAKLGKYGEGLTKPK
jgi:hypothetical protein